MKTNLTTTPLKGLLVVDIEFFEDERGFFIETWNQRDFAAAGLNLKFLQENHSSSEQNVLRGLHYQGMNAPIGKLVRCTSGTIFDVAVDLRASSPTFGKWYGLELSARNKKQLWVPVGFAHGFLTLSAGTEVQYRQTDFYAPEFEGGIRWNDPDIGVEWPISDPILSGRDTRHPSFEEYTKNPAFR
jgi:dTDP-4-dehydrorhamnose 3,5-epimerase